MQIYQQQKIRMFNELRDKLSAVVFPKLTNSTMQHLFSKTDVYRSRV